MWLAIMDLSRELGAEQPFYGLQSLGLDGTEAPRDSIEEMARRYISEIRSVQPHGPYALIGACFGGTVAFEMARQLLEAGEEVAFLGLLDLTRREGDETSGRLVSTPRVLKRAKAVGGLVTGRLRLYLQDMRGLDNGDRIKFITNKVRSLTFKIKDNKAFRGVQREIHQLEVYRANVCALDRYHLKPLTGRLRTVEIFETEHRRIQGKNDPSDWSVLSMGRTVRHLMPGKDSGDMVSGKNARVLGPLLAERLRAAFIQQSGGVVFHNPISVRGRLARRSED